jgi:hypothetical protein
MATDDRWERWSAAAGIVFVVLFVALFFVSPETPPDATAQSLAAFYNERGVAGPVVDFYLVGLGAAALLWFSGTVRATLRRAEGEPGRLSSLAFGGGAAAAMLLVVGGSLFIAPAAEVVFGDLTAIDPVLDETIGTAGFLAVNFAMIPAALMFTAASLVALRTGVLPPWFGWVGLIAAFILVANLLLSAVLFFVGFYVFLAWILVTSVLLLARPAATTRRTRATTHRAARR